MRLRSYKSLKQGIAVAIFFSLGMLLFWLGATKFLARPVSAQAGAQADIEEVRPAFSTAAIQTDLKITAAEASGFVLYQDGNQTVCRQATSEQAQAFARRDPELPLRAINHGEPGLSSRQQAQTGLRIILRSTAQLDGFPAAKAAFIRAAQTWESLIRTPITVVIDVDFGPRRFGQDYPAGAIGATAEQPLGDATLYPSVRTKLIQGAANPQLAALYNALPSGQLATDIGQTAAIISPSALLRVYGLINAVADPDAERQQFGNPPSIGFNSAFPYDFDPSDGIAADKNDFDAIATHELGHVLGFISRVGLSELLPALGLNSAVLDFFRFRPGITTNAFPTANRILSSGGAQIFFAGGSELAFSTGRPDAMGGDGEQASHWKDDAQSGVYLGIMDPKIPLGLREQITRNDLNAFEAMGYQVKADQLPEELKLDDGSVETGVSGNGLMVANRFTPSVYPSKLQTVRVFIGQAFGQPNPSGQQIRLIAFNGMTGDNQPPASPPLLLDQSVTIPPLLFPDFVDIPIQNGPTITGGDWYIGYQVPSPSNGVVFWLDKNGPQAQKTYFSFTGAGFQPLTSGMPPTPANAAIRAVVAPQAVAAGPNIIVTPSTLGFGNVNLSATADRTLTISNTGTDTLNVTGITSTNARFSVTSAASFSVAAGAQQTATVRFAPTAAGNQSGMLTIASNDPDQPTFAIPISGTGIDPQPTNRVVRAGNAQGSPGGTVQVPVELVAQGNENALGFSLTFDAAILSNPQVVPGSGAASASLNVNGLQTGQGRLGVAISLPSGQSFAAGTSQLMVVTFTVANNTQAASASVGFGDQPISREVVDATANPLPASYAAGTVTISTGYEADVAPRPNGSGNGTVTISDWVQVGRFVAGLDQANAGSEFQRADVAPKEARGNGSLSIADWVQAGRYAAGLDPVVAAGGPTVPAQLRNADFRMLKEASVQQARALRIGNASIERGQQGAVAIELDAQGNENALGFSLGFDPAQLQFVSAALGNGATGATLNVNGLQAANGRVGLAVALPAGQGFAAGVRQILTLTFTAAAAGNGANSALSFSDSPIAREVSDPFANILPATFTSGAVTLTRSVATVSAASFLGQTLAQEAIVAAFGGSLATKVEIASTLPLPTQLGGTTVRVRDSAGVERLAPLFFVAPGQINYQIPPSTAAGAATVTITSGDGLVSTGNATIASVAPGLFTANASGQGPAAAVVLRVKADGALIYEPAVRFDGSKFVSVPIDLGPETDQVFLLLFGTGWRFRSALSGVTVLMDGAVNSEVLYAGDPGEFAGQDQINVRIPRSLIGKGEIDLALTVDGRAANAVRINVK